MTTSSFSNMPLDNVASTKTWEDLCVGPKLINILKSNKYETPSKTQARFLSELKKDPKNSGMCEAPTGTGKTLAYLIAAVQNVKVDKKVTQVAIICHTNMLAV